MDNVKEITVEELYKLMKQNKQLRLIDVRRAEEYNNELGHIEGAELITLGETLTSFLKKGDRSEPIVFVCRSGARSGVATEESIKLGYQFTLNMLGGMISWNEKKLPVKKD